MRKNLLFGLFATMVLLLTTACQKENDLLGNGEATISFEISTPQMATRAFSDGTTAKQLQYAVYDENGAFIGRLSPNAVEFKPVEITDFNGKRTINIQLAAGKTYYVLFWASALNSPYSVDYKTKTLSVDYTNTVCNSDANDAFYCYKKVTVDATKSEPVTLTRPFAQLNIGTNDLEKLDGVKADKTSVAVTGIYETLNLASKELGGNINEERTFTLAARPVDTDVAVGEFPVADYDYLAMAYLLVGDEKKVVNVEFSYGDDDAVQTRTFTNIPVIANHRTNIYGALLTNNIGFDVEIDKDFDEPDENLYYVSVDGVHYTDFAEAVAKALELNKPIDFITDVKIDADNTITVPEGQTLTLNLNGQTLYGETDDADKNDDNKITSADNEVMFDVRGTMNVNGGTVGIKHVGESYKDFGWNACGEVFYVGFNGKLNVENATIENYGGVPMAYAIDMVNASVTRAAEAGIYVNVDNSTIKSSYIPVRVFNNGAGMNNVTIENTTLEGTSRAFWVHIYTQADDSNFFNNGKDTNGNGYKDETLNINIYNPTCHNTFIADNPERIIEYGFTNEINFREDGSQIFKLQPIYDAEGEEIEGVGKIDDNTYGVTLANGLKWLAEKVDKGENFAGKTIKLLADIDLYEADANDEAVCFNPIGSYRFEKSFTGVFDGQNHSIKNLNQNTWALDNGYAYTDCGLGLFGALEDATVKDLKIDNASISGESAICGVVAAVAHNTTFENVIVTNSDCADYQYYSGGIVGWVSGECTFTDCNIDASTTVAAQWGDFDNSIGGVIGGASGSAEILMKDCTVACRIDAYNDVTSSYQWYAYRRSGMLIGNPGKTKVVDGATYADAPQLTCENVTVIYGDWANYTYCEFAGTSWPYVRVQAGVSNSAYSNPRYGHPTDANGNEVVDDNHVHNDGEDHHILCKFDQLYGGGQGVYGTPTHEGVTVIYPESYTPGN